MVDANATTLGQLRAGGHHRETVKQELRRNLLSRLRQGEELFPGIVGYANTVVPQLANALISGHDTILLGERGQAKSRIMRSLVNLLDGETPVLAGCEINDHPYAPICQRCRQLIADKGDEAPVVWLPRERRYGEKLATPDISIADLIGEVDPIKVAEGRYLSDELTIHYGLVPRCNRGIFAINELPDLAERIQVGLLTIMEEKDVQIRGYMVRMPLDLMVVASANPEDYTSRGRIVTPLKDRFGSQVRTHYPLHLQEEIAIMEQEAAAAPHGIEVIVPSFMTEIVAEMTHLARRSPHISQVSGVSVRMSIGNFETLVANSIRRAAQLNETLAVPRISDLQFLVASTVGRIEIEALEEGHEGRILEQLRQGAVAAVFGRHFSTSQFEPTLRFFQGKNQFEVGDSQPAVRYLKKLGSSPDIDSALQELGLPDHPETRAAAVEFVLEGLHLNKRLNKDDRNGSSLYQP
jgi:magnesium chelatase subunit I